MGCAFEVDPDVEDVPVRDMAGAVIFVVSERDDTLATSAEGPAFADFDPIGTVLPFSLKRV